MKNYKEFALLVEYVEKMKQHYGMQDSSFQWFAMTIKKEYEFFEFISKDIEKIKKLRWKPF
jgi:arginyl-tRNA--protein-N-Asp/Glu arginylyltransferase